MNLCFLAYPINVIPYRSAISMDRHEGDVREIKIGTLSCAAFCSISELMRPVVMRMRFSGQTLFL